MNIPLFIKDILKAIKVIIFAILLSIVAFLGALTAYAIAKGFPAYMYAVHLEEKWEAANPKTKVELEKYLDHYSTRIIDPSESLWGNAYPLKKNERMVQYLILWSMPLDVVYDDKDNIKAIYTSYE